MRIIKTLVLFISFGSLNYGVMAQDLNPLTTSAFFKRPVIGKSYVAPAIGNGSPYLVENWTSGYVVLTSNDTVVLKYMRFDCLKNELVWTKEGQIPISIDPDFIKEFGLKTNPNLTERRFERTTLKLPLITDTMVRFLEILVKGSLKLYALRNIAVDNELVPGRGLRYLPVYKPETVFYLQIGNLPMKRIKIKKRSLTDAYPEYAEQIEQILHSKHYGQIRKEYQLVESVKLINDNW